MEITQHPGADSLELRLSGRIDATWGEHLGATIENAVRAGAHRIVLNLQEVQYISSLGISVLFLQYRLLKSVNGSLTITHPNKMCRTDSDDGWVDRDSGRATLRRPAAVPRRRLRES